jgi:hypothetical protein
VTQDARGIIEIYDSDWLSQLPDSTRLKMLNERDVYILLGMALASNWHTRYAGDTSQIDFTTLRNEMVYNLMHDVDFCTLVAECIDDSDIVQQSIENYLSQSSQTIQDILTKISDIQNAQLSTIAQDDCDDRRWAGIERIVERLNTNNIDFLQYATDSASDVLDRVEGLIEGIPLLGKAISLTGIDELVEFVQELSQDLRDEYENADTTALRESVMCDIFCNTGGCNITVDDVLQAYVNLLPAGILDITTDAFIDVVGFVVAGTLVTTNYWAMVNILQLLALKLKSEFFGFATETITVEFARGSASPNNGWTLLCACDTCYIYDFSIGQLGWRASESTDNDLPNGAKPTNGTTPASIYNTGVGWASKEFTQQTGSDVTGTYIIKRNMTAVTISRIEVVYDASVTPSVDGIYGLHVRIRNNGSSWSTTSVDGDDMATGSDVVQSVTIDDTADELFVGIRTALGSGGNAIIKAIRIYAQSGTPDDAVLCS